MDEIRINKYIADAGICSRRGADRLIADGRITVNGAVAVSGMKVTNADTVLFDGATVGNAADRVYLIFNKPVGIVCTDNKKEKNNITDYINYGTRITYAGRLDKDSKGLMLMTNDGDLIDVLMRARNVHEKEYVVTVDKPIDNNFIYAIRNGVYLDGLNVTTRKCKASLIDSKTFRITLTEGHNRQIRRMCEALSRNVTELERIRIVNLMLGDLMSGEYRNVTESELDTLFDTIGYTAH